jgi:hypothetical protein
MHGMVLSIHCMRYVHDVLENLRTHYSYYLQYIPSIEYVATE